MQAGSGLPRDDGRSPWLLWGTASPRLDLALTVLTALALLGSRFALLASGPWEWDETIFARGMLHFQLAPHFPQPPGFPGLLALGHVLLPLAGEPIVALQWVSALATIAMVWPLAALGRRVAPAAVAASAALLVVQLPGPWLFSVRGFSTIPATALAVGAAALLAGGLHGRRATWFTLLLTAAFLVRPVLLPPIGLLWLLGAVRVSPATRLLPGVALGTAAVGLATAAMVWLEGGWTAFVTPFVTHADFHAARLHLNSDDVSIWGLLTGVGGPLPAAALGLASVVGFARWARRRGPRAALAWALVLGVTVAQLVWLQNRTYARYATVVHLGVAPLVAGAAGLLPTPAAIAGLLAATALSTWRTAPLVVEQHSEPFGAWQATVEAERIARERGWTAVVGPEIHPFASYRWHVRQWRGEPTPPRVLSPRAPEPFVGIDGPWVVATAHPQLYPPWTVEGERTFGDVSPRLVPLTQRRFLEATVLEGAPLPVGKWWPRERLPDGGVFLWAGPDAELWLPPAPTGSWIGLELRPAPGDAPLVVEIDGPDDPAVVGGRSDRTWVWSRRTDVVATAPVIARLGRERADPPPGGDGRELSVQVFDAVVRRPSDAFAGPAATARQRAALGLDTADAYPSETFAEGTDGAWLAPDARLDLRVPGPGVVELRLSAPRVVPPGARVSVDGGDPLEIDALGPSPVDVAVPVGTAAAADGIARIRLTSTPFVPAEAGLGSDTRRLGVVLHGVRFSGGPAAGEPTGGALNGQ